MLGIGINIGTRRPLIGQGMAAETQSLLARMTVAPSPARAAAINTLIAALKAGGSWAEMDAFYVLAAHTSQAALLNWKQNAYNLAVTGAPVFVANSHYVGDGITDLLSTGFDITTAIGASHTQNDAHMAVWCLNDPGATQGLCGSGTGLIQTHPTTAGGITYRANRASGTNHTASVVVPGYCGWDRAASNADNVFFAGVDVGGGATVSAVSSATYVVLAAGSTEGAGQIRFFHFGGHLTAGQWLATYNALVAYNAAL